MHKFHFIFYSYSFSFFLYIFDLLMAREESSLNDIERGPDYGSISSESIVHRKRHRIQQRQCRPKLLSNCFSSKSVNDPDLVLPALDPR